MAMSQRPVVMDKLSSSVTFFGARIVMSMDYIVEEPTDQSLGNILCQIWRSIKSGAIFFPCKKIVKSRRIV